MSRFDRQATEGGDLPALLGTATEEFRRSLERHVQQIVEAAKGQAAEIERDAERSANQKEQQLDLRAQELVQGVITRASSVLDSIELVQTAISGMLAELRAEVKALESGKSGASGELGPSSRPQSGVAPVLDQRVAKETPPQPAQPQVAKEAPPRPPQPQVARETPPRPAQPQVAAGSAEAGATSNAESTAPAPTPGDSTPPEQAQVPAGEASPANTPTKTPPAQESRSVATPQSTPRAQQQPVADKPPPQPGPPADAEKPGPLIENAPVEPKAQPDRKDSSAEFDQMIHGEIRRMFHSGKAREDVESFLGRFELGDSYVGLLDELYSQKDPSGRRRIFGRRRDR